VAAAFTVEPQPLVRLTLLPGTAPLEVGVAKVQVTVSTSVPGGCSTVIVALVKATSMMFSTQFAFGQPGAPEPASPVLQSRHQTVCCRSRSRTPESPVPRQCHLCRLLTRRPVLAGPGLTQSAVGLPVAVSLTRTSPPRGRRARPLPRG
jgi:hypothetical protein